MTQYSDTNFQTVGGYHTGQQSPYTPYSEPTTPTTSGGALPYSNIGRDIQKASPFMSMIPGVGPWVAIGIQLLGGILGGLSKPKVRRNPMEEAFANTVSFYSNLGKKYSTYNSMRKAFTGTENKTFNLDEQIDKYGLEPKDGGK